MTHAGQPFVQGSLDVPIIQEATMPSSYNLFVQSYVWFPWRWFGEEHTHVNQALRLLAEQARRYKLFAQIAGFLFYNIITCMFVSFLSFPIPLSRAWFCLAYGRPRTSELPFDLSKPAGNRQCWNLSLHWNRGCGTVRIIPHRTFILTLLAYVWRRKLIPILCKVTAKAATVFFFFF